MLYHVHVYICLTHEDGIDDTAIGLVARQRLLVVTAILRLVQVGQTLSQFVCTGMVFHPRHSHQVEVVDNGTMNTYSPAALGSHLANLRQLERPEDDVVVFKFLQIEHITFVFKSRGGTGAGWVKRKTKNPARAIIRGLRPPFCL